MATSDGQESEGPPQPLLPATASPSSYQYGHSSTTPTNNAPLQYQPVSNEASACNERLQLGSINTSGNRTVSAPANSATRAQKIHSQPSAPRKTLLKKRKLLTGGRGVSFTRMELDSLLDALEEHLPACHQEWEAMARIHNSQFQDENRTADSLRRKFAQLYRTRVQPGHLRIPPEVLRAKRIREAITERKDVGEEEESEINPMISGQDTEENSDDNEEVQEEAEGEGESVGRSIANKGPTGTSLAAKLIIHKRGRPTKLRDEKMEDLLAILKVSLLQDMERRAEERERAERSRAEERERREEERRIREEQREEERQYRKQQREEERARRQEERQSREAFMRILMMMVAKGASNQTGH